MLQSITVAVTRLEEKKAIKLVKYAINNGATVPEIFDAIQCGLDNVGHNFTKGCYGVTDLMMAGIIFEEILKLPFMKPKEDVPQDAIGTILLCTVESDLHDIGKAIFKNAALMTDFNVIDLGIDISSDQIVLSVAEHHPDILALSSIMTNGLKYVKKTNDALIAAHLRNNLKIILGGLSTHRDSVDYLGVDAFSNDVYEGVRLCKKWVEEKNNEL
ncbi:MAG: cobalamin-dependent protein [Eubacterium sp.]